MKLGDYQRAAEGFRQFADLFYLDPQRNDARLLASECFSLFGFWAEAEAEAEHVLKDMLLEDEMERSALRLFAEACFEQRKLGTKELRKNTIQHHQEHIKFFGNAFSCEADVSITFYFR